MIGQEDLNNEIFVFNFKLKECSLLVSDVHLKLRGHRSIVNQCRYNKKYHLLATSGVEKVIKIWSPYEMPGNCSGGLLGRQSEYTPKRRLYTYNDLFSLRNPQSNPVPTTTPTVSTGTPNASMDPNDLALISYVPVIRNRLNTEIEESIEEDPIMIAFFDSQVNRRQARQKEASKKKRLTTSGSISIEESSNSIYTCDNETENEALSESETSQTSGSSESSSSSSLSGRLG